MCGIYGAASVGRPIRPEVTAAMDRVLRHRGPNDSGLYTDEHVALGQRRLSIIDLDGGHQPIGNEDGQVQVVFNGEIYNYRELRRELEARGHCFATDSDTEVLVHLYEDRGEALCEPLRGMFAFALWDRRSRTLLLARDRLGIKPLYYAQVGPKLLFASEIKALLCDPDLPRSLDETALDYYLRYSTTPLDRSMVAGVRKLEPAHLLRWDGARGGTLSKRRYWELVFAPVTRSLAQEQEEVRAALEDAVRCHLLADVEVGAFLSGGIDSATVTALAARQVGKLRTFSIGFDEPQFNELPWARRVAARYGTEHTELVVRPDIESLLPHLLWHLDEPLADESAVPTYLVSKLAASHVKVVLSGDGGDELFGGYDKYGVELHEARRHAAMPQLLRSTLGLLGRALPHGARGKRFLQHAALDFPERFLDAQVMFPAQERRALLDRPLAIEARADEVPRALLRAPAPDALARLLRFDHALYLPLDILTKVDRMSMAFGLEVRPPLLDHRLVELAATLPSSHKLRPATGETKWIFRRAVRDLVPPGLLARRKWGFGIPAQKWLSGPLRGFTESVLRDRRTTERGLLRPAAIEGLLARNRGGERDESHKLWALLVLELWQRQFLDAGLAVPAPAPPAIDGTAALPHEAAQKPSKREAAHG